MPNDPLDQRQDMRDFRDMLSLLSKHGAEFLVVGAHALGVHDLPRATGDLDLWVRADPKNGPRLWNALIEFGAPLDEFEPAEWEKPGVGLHIGLPPGRIDIMTLISGVTFEEAWLQRVTGELFNQPVSVIGIQALMANKRASGREKDALDLKRLEARFGPMND